MNRADVDAYVRKIDAYVRNALGANIVCICDGLEMADFLTKTEVEPQHLVYSMMQFQSIAAQLGHS